MGKQIHESVPQALVALAGLVQTAQIDDPFGPVTVVVPSHASGLDVAHYLGRTLNDGRGSVSVRTFTLWDLAVDLVAMANTAQGRSLLPPMIREGAISSVLAGDPGLFAAVADQPATVRAIARTSLMLDSVDEPSEFEFPTLVNEVMRIHRKAAPMLTTSWLTGSELFGLAKKALLEPRILRRLGLVVGFMLPSDEDPSGSQFRAMLEERTSMRALRAAGEMTTETTVYTTSDADDEARSVVRLVAERIGSGLPGHRIGVFYSAAAPYRALLAQRMAEAGISFVGADAHSLSDAPIARGLIRLLGLDATAPDLRIILDVLAEGTLVWKGRHLPSSAACERLYVAPPDEDEAESEEPEHVIRRRSDLILFHGFVNSLARQIGQVLQAESWLEAAAELEVLINEFMGPRSEKERRELKAARDQVAAFVGDLRLLQDVAPAPSPASIRSMMESVINAKGGWTGKSGTGVSLGSYIDGVGRDLDVVYIVGTAEGLAPARLQEDPLLPDTVRLQLGSGLPTVEDRAAATKEQFFALLATGYERTITFPRGNLRAGGAYQPSRWLTNHTPEGWRPVPLPSHASGIATGAPTTCGLAPTAQEWRLRRCMESDAGPSVLADDAALLNALEVRRHHRDGLFSRFNGNLSGRAGLLPDPEQAISPTRLEDWVVSPLAYFLRRILKVEIFQDVSLEVEIGRLQKGNLLHSVLEDFVREAMEGSRTPSSDRLLELADAAFEREANPAWLGYLWERDMAAMRQDLRAVFTADQDRRSAGWRYLAAEVGFGTEDGTAHPPVQLELLDGSTIHFRGKVDRVDRHVSGQIKVIDYKTGMKDKYTKLKAENPTADGTRFQLPVYGLFARQMGGSRTVEVDAEYWFISQSTGGGTAGFTITEDVIETLRSDASQVIFAMRKGYFPPRPESGQYTNFSTMMGHAGVQQTWHKLSEADELREIVCLYKGDK